MQKNKEINHGFTLIELLVVIAIISVLATMGVVFANYARNQARIGKARHDVAEIYTAISILANDSGEWPGHQTVNAINSAANNEICGEDINSMACAVKLSDPESGLITTDGGFSNWSGPYMKRLPTDPWGREYFLDTDYIIDIDDNPSGCGGGGNSDAVVVGSYGPDEQGVPSGGAPGSYGCDDIIKIIK